MVTYKHILVPTDFSKQSEAAAARGSDLAQHYGARLSVLHVVDYVLPGYVRVDVPEASAEKLVARASQTLADGVKRLGLKPANAWVEVGSAKRGVIDKIKQQGIDLVVLGSHGQGGLALLLGSTTNGVMQETPCDVLAVRTKT